MQTIVPYPAFPERINSVLTATNQAQSCLLLRLKSRNASGAFHHLSFIGNFLILVDFGVRDAILLGGASSGQTSIKCCDLACDAEPPPSINWKLLIMKLEVKYLFPTLSTVQLQLPNFPTSFFIFIYQLPENVVWGWEKHYHMVSQNNLQTREDNFWIFMELYVSKAQLALPHGNFINGVANPEIVC